MNQEKNSKPELTGKLADKVAAVPGANVPAVPPPKDKFSVFQDWMKKYEKDFQMVIPKHVSSDRIIRLAISAARRNPSLMACSLPSVIGGLMEAASLGLECNSSSHEAALVPFNNLKTGVKDAQLIIEYEGYIKLFLNHPAAETIFAREAREGDLFDYAYGTAEFLTHKPRKEDRGEITYFYAYAKMKGGGYRFIVLSKSDVDDIRDKFSKDYKSRGEASIWAENYVAMGCKTAIRALQHYLPKSAEFSRAIEADYKVVDPLNDTLTDISGMVNAE